MSLREEAVFPLLHAKAPNEGGEGNEFILAAIVKKERRENMSKITPFVSLHFGHFKNIISFTLKRKGSNLSFHR